MNITKSAAWQWINCAALFASSVVFAHDTELHSLMSQQAAISSENFTRFFDDNFGNGTWPQLKFAFNSKTLTATAWISKGSVDEDDYPRFVNHFYTPAVRGESSARGLTDPPMEGVPVSSFEWVTEAQPSHPNSESWKKARQYELDGFTKVSQTERDANLGHMFQALGHVVHLNQDLSQPSHTRDDNHFHYPGDDWPDGSKIEKYGLRQYYQSAVKVGYGSAFPTSTRTWSQWRSAGFNKLEDFWDRKKYKGQAQALVANEAGSGLTQTTLGLGEYSNGNFLSDDALYAEVKNLEPRHRFPFPSLASGTDYRTALQLPSTAARPVFLREDFPKTRLYFAKTKDNGKQMTYHSSWSYLTAKKKEVVKVSINDNNVLQEYHSILIPKAIEYSAGILDYFFRGRLQAQRDASNANLWHITNLSGEGLSGGTFKLYYEEPSGTRSEVPAVNYSFTYPGSLANNGTLDLTLTGSFPFQPAGDFYLVYKGTIGGGTDPVDDGNAIAVVKFASKPDFTQIQWSSTLIQADPPAAFDHGPSFAGFISSGFQAYVNSDEWPASTIASASLSATGTLNYSGTGARCVLSVNAPDVVGNSTLGISVFLNGSPLVGVNETDIHDASFTIPACENGTITISAGITTNPGTAANPVRSYVFIEVDLSVE